jgi:hypothetical protein
VVEDKWTLMAQLVQISERPGFCSLGHPAVFEAAEIFVT